MDGSAQKTSRRWRPSRAELAATTTPDETWCPLDGLLPEYIPTVWDGPHVGLRLVEAFKTLANLPGGLPTLTASGYWPAYLWEYEDELAQEQSDDEIKAERMRARNFAKARPNAQDVTRMEIAMIWPGRYLADPVMAKIVQRVALYRSRDQDMQQVSYRMKMGAKILRKRNRVGLDLIASGLRRDGVSVF
jgi:hypothetical protein